MRTTIYSDVLNGKTGHAVNRLYRISQDKWLHEILADQIEFGENCIGKFEKTRATTERFSTNIEGVIINIDKKINFERVEAFRRVVKEKRYVVEIISINRNPVYLEGEEIKKIFDSIDERRIYAKYVKGLKEKKDSNLESSIGIE